LIINILKSIFNHNQNNILPFTSFKNLRYEVSAESACHTIKTKSLQNQYD
jgi:hypothetical protein